MLTSGRVDTKVLTRAHYPLEQAVEAFERSMTGDVIKVFIHCSDALGQRK
jgi:threonine dehydrogenase-like Zn-dependent dehydrogenase